jgi:hypothetical protein
METGHFGPGLFFVCLDVVFVCAVNGVEASWHVAWCGLHMSGARRALCLALPLGRRDCAVVSTHEYVGKAVRHRHCAARARWIFFSLTAQTKPPKQQHVKHAHTADNCNGGLWRRNIDEYCVVTRRADCISVL